MESVDEAYVGLVRSDARALHLYFAAVPRFGGTRALPSGGLEECRLTPAEKIIAYREAGHVKSRPSEAMTEPPNVSSAMSKVQLVASNASRP